MKTLSSYLEMGGGLDGEEGIGRKDGGGGGGGVHANQTQLNLRIWGMSVHGEGRGDKQLCLFHLAGIRGSVPPSPSPPASSDVNQLFAGSARIKDNPLGGGVEAGVGGGILRSCLQRLAAIRSAKSRAVRPMCLDLVISARDP